MSTQAFVTVVNFAPTPLGFVQLPSNSNDVEVVEGFAYVAAAEAGLVVVNTSNPEHPAIVSTLDTPGESLDVRVDGDNLYLADGSGGLRIYDISNPGAPIFLATAALSSATDVSIANGFAYVANGANGLAVIDVSLPNAPITLDAVTGNSPLGVDTDGTSLVTVDANQLHVYDIQNPAVPVLLGSITSNANLDVVVRDQFAYIAALTEGFRVVDISDPLNLVNTVGDNQFFPRDVALFEDHAFYGERLFVSATPYVNIADPANPVFQGFVDFSIYGDYDGIGMAVDPNYFYMVAQKGVGARLYIGQHSIVEDTAGIAPQAIIDRPSVGSSAYSGVINDFEVTATDDVKVASVRFSMNGGVLGVKSSQPYRFGFTPPVGAADVTLSATAFDIAGNESLPVEITVPVIELVVGPEQLLLIVESVHVPGALPKLTQLVDIADVDTQQETANAALALAGWGLDGIASVFDVPDWTDRVPLIRP